MHLLQRLFKRGIYGYDRNSLHPFERSLMEAILSLRIANLLFMSVQAQIKVFIEFRSVHLGGVPDWLNRIIDVDSVIIEQSRFVGAEYGAPPLDQNPSFKFTFELSNAQSGSGVIVLDQAIRTFTLSLPSTSATYSGHVVNAEALNITDERSYWVAKRDELGRIGPKVVDAINNCQFSEDVIVCPNTHCASNSLFGVDLCASYKQVLRFADGIRVNGLSIMGSVDNKNRIFEEKGSKYLSIGEDRNASYAYRVDGGAITEQLIRFKHQSADTETLDATLVELLEDAMI